MSVWRAVIFDLDDTLYPEEQFVRGGLRAVGRHVEQELGIPRRTVWQELQLLRSSSVHGKLLEAWIEQRQMRDATLLTRLVDAYRAHPPRLRLHPGLRQLLGALRDTRRLGVVSDGWLAVQQRKFQALALEGLFQAVVFSDQWGREFWKPHPRPFATVLAQVQCNAEEAVYIGDNPSKDFIGCRKLGMSTVQLRLPEGVYRDVAPPTSDHAADRVVHSIPELDQVLG